MSVLIILFWIECQRVANNKQVRPLSYRIYLEQNHSDMKEDHAEEKTGTDRQAGQHVLEWIRVANPLESSST